MKPRPLLLAAQAALLAMLGCASASPFNQRFIEVRTPNFHLTSSLGVEATEVLARDLEIFHTGVLFALGLDAEDTAGPPTRVLAFDGRGVSRPFAIRGASAFLVPAIDSPLLVIRSVGGFRERIVPDLRHQYAHRILRDRSRRRPPLWYEEGRAQIARSVDVEARGVQIGRQPTEPRSVVLDWRRSDWRSVLGRRDLSGESELGLRRFEAQAWALVHTMLFDSSQRSVGERLLEPVQRASEAGDLRALAVAVEALGSDESLSERIYTHLESDRHRVDRMRVEEVVESGVEPASVPIAVARDRLGRLALELDRPALALDYFERALDEQADHVPAQAGRLWAVSRPSTPEWPDAEIEARLESMTAAARGNTEASFRLGLAWLALAQRSETPEQARRRSELARAHLARGLDQASTAVAIGRSYLGKGGDPEEARRWFERAQTKSPGALRIDLALAEAELALGRPGAARSHLSQVLSRSHSAALRQQARDLLDQLR